VLGIIEEVGITAGNISDKTGLSTGMVTTVVDRLEKKEYVYRDKDPNDRRKVIIKLNLNNVTDDIAPLFKSFGQEMGKLFSSYNEKELALLHDFMDKCTELFRKETQKLKGHDIHF
jgi:DNA-binding MarR family transcriptional regulator